MNDVIRSIYDGNVIALVMIDLSAAFDTVDHDTLLNILHKRFAITDIPLTNRTLLVSVNGAEAAAVTCGVPGICCRTAGVYIIHR